MLKLPTFQRHLPHPRSSFNPLHFLVMLRGARGAGSWILVICSFSLGECYISIQPRSLPPPRLFPVVGWAPLAPCDAGADRYKIFGASLRFSRVGSWTTGAEKPPTSCAFTGDGTSRQMVNAHPGRRVSLCLSPTSQFSLSKYGIACVVHAAMTSRITLTLQRLLRAVVALVVSVLLVWLPHVPGCVAHQWSSPTVQVERAVPGLSGPPAHSTATADTESTAKACTTAAMLPPTSDCSITHTMVVSSTTASAASAASAPCSAALTAASSSSRPTEEKSSQSLPEGTGASGKAASEAALATKENLEGRAVNGWNAVAQEAWELVRQEYIDQALLDRGLDASGDVPTWLRPRRPPLKLDLRFFRWHIELHPPSCCSSLRAT